MTADGSARRRVRRASPPPADDPDEQPLSPAERYALARDRDAHPLLTEWEQTRPFRLDEFQVAACRALEEGRGVLVCAPTGAGKTIVGEFAVARALATGGKCFYTTPIKALSNQKYADLVAEHGAATVGLLTGDTSVNSHAPVVVMTTEVLRNMLYASSPDLVGLSAVVMDEVHYLADKFRGPVWEEVILHLPETVQVVGLSATVSNAEEFGAWLQQVRGDTAVIVDEHRPVPLWQHMLVGRRLHDLFATGHDAELAVAAPPGSLGQLRIDPSLTRAVNDAEARTVRGPRGGGRTTRERGRGGQSWGGARLPSRAEVIDKLDGAGLLPAITFIFSRAGCEAAVTQCVRSGLRLVTEAERQRIREVVDRRAATLPEADLGVLGFWEWREALEMGIAAHHAGLLPAFKETVEELFVAGLVKAVFATETLALGINMPARTVVLERLVKYNGEGHVDLTPGEYTQLTGRAGRRGIDVEGHAVVLWSPGVDPRQVGGLASRRTYPLRSSFAPSYNMAVNLTDRLGRVEAKLLLQQSFAQFQADAGVSGLARQVVRGEQSAAEAARRMQCHLGDVAEYGDLLHQLSEAEKVGSRSGAALRREQLATDLAALRRGDVIAIPAGRRAGLAVVLDPGLDADGEGRPLVVTADRWSGRLGSADVRGPLPVVGRIRLAKHVNHRSPQVRKDLAASIRAADVTPPPSTRRRAAADPASEAGIAALRAAVRRHPVHGCAERHEHLQWWRRLRQTETEIEAMRSRVADATHSLGEHLDRILALLDHLGYVSGDTLTDAGRMLARIWGEADLLTAECLRQGIWDALTPAELAAAVSALVYSARRDTPGAPAGIPGPAGAAIRRASAIRLELVGLESEHRLTPMRDLDPGFAEAVRAWTAGESLSDALDAAAGRGTELPAGDFVRWCRQVVDLLDQVRVVAHPELAATAAAAVHVIRRGVVALGAV